MIKITNPRTGVSKTINTLGYSYEDHYKTFSVYSKAGYEVQYVAE
jgi:hypothetical protein